MMNEFMPLADSSLVPLPESIRNGMIALGTCGLISLLCTVSFFLFFTYRMIYWEQISSNSAARIQVFLLIYNLFIADIIQASSFVTSFWWISQNKLIGPNLVCDIQGLLIQIGDVASGLWALAIAIHTFVNIVGQKTVSHRTFITLVASLWVFIIILAGIGPIRIRSGFFVPAGAWCWVNSKHDAERIYLHYLWIFISQLGSVGLYTFIFFYLRLRINANSPIPRALPLHQSVLYGNTGILNEPAYANPTNQNYQMNPDPRTSNCLPNSFATSRTYILKSASHMVVYTLAYLVLTLPLAVGRAASMAGFNVPPEFFAAAGTLMACSGFVDVVLYVGTRRLLVMNGLHRTIRDDAQQNMNSCYDSRSSNVSGQLRGMDFSSTGEKDRFNKLAVVDSKISASSSNLGTDNARVNEDPTRSCYA
ncbi:Bgt-3780 [Blumeria graminis f. sp. tritici]|uniref:Bgt-3780 n=2 Tax=Blumeria graminis f. sp. tritici TaxID=62690 RepID=A0A381L895_BLUGR|nr:hypothetical protein BGT96224_3780 [Blumeria graminis f. sp. tritici 96224]VDB92571.1 Bgt-3780 [Blumeria graminis f. sp. tritici]